MEKAQAESGMYDRGALVMVIGVIFILIFLGRYAQIHGLLAQ